MRWYDETCPAWCFAAAKLAAREATRQAHVRTYTKHEREIRHIRHCAWRKEATRLYRLAIAS